MSNRRSFFKKLIGFLVSSTVVENITPVAPVIPLHTFKIAKTTVVAGTRKLRVGWSKEAEADLMRMSGIRKDTWVIMRN